jgi:hypothetical protein
VLSLIKEKLDMKDLIKVFIWIGIVFGFWLIFPIFVGLSALKKLDQAKSKADLGSTPILVLLFVSPIAGILLFVIDDKALAGH